MQPLFILSLSVQKIALLHRTSAGWHLVGDLRTNSDRLERQLEDLRRKGAALEPKGLRCLLAIPDDQIRYLEVEAPAGGASLGFAAQALEGTTPYEVRDLVYDWRESAGRVQIAAVARETLGEAEEFASHHKFNPVGFIAMPAEGLFGGTPNFGAAKAAESLLGPGTRVQPPHGPVKILGAAELPEAPATPQESTAPGKSAEGASPAPEAEAPKPAAPAASVPALDAIARITPTAMANDEGTDDAPAASDDASGGISEEAGAAPAFSSRRGPGKVPQLGGVARSGDDSLPPPPPPLRDDAPEIIAEPAVLRRETPAAPAAPLHEPPLRSPAPDGTASRARPLGLIVTAGLLALLVLIAIWAALFLEDGLAGLWRSSEPPTVASAGPEALAPAPGLATEVPQVTGAADSPVSAAPPAGSDGPGLDTAASAVPSGQPVRVQDEVAALSGPGGPDASQPAMAAQPGPVDAPGLPASPGTVAAPAPGAPLSPEAVQDFYVLTGVWQSAPGPIRAPRADSIDSVVVAAIDPAVQALDAIALPEARALRTDSRPGQPASPARAGTTYDLDERGRVRATAEGALSPDGIRVIAGPPPVRPPLRPVNPAAEAEENAARSALAAFRPRLRPETLAESAERSRLGGRTLSELAALRPRPRPEGLSAAAQAAIAAATASAMAQETDGEEAGDDLANAIATSVADSLANQGTEQAVAASLEPVMRPSGLAERARQAAQAAPAPSAQPSIPTRASVARQATVTSAINLRRINLIGVYGKPSDRRALVRLPSGRYIKVKVGDNIDGGQVADIGATELRYVKRGRSVVLEMPKG